MKTIQQRYEEAKTIPCDINEHLSTLMRYGQQCGSIVELGVRDGLSTLALLNARPKKMRSYDIRLTEQAKDIYKQAKLEATFHRQMHHFEYLLLTLYPKWCICLWN